MHLSRSIKCLLAVLTLTAGTAYTASAYIQHKVQRNESLWGLAKKYKVSPDDITKANPSAARGLKTGQILLIPEPGDLDPSKATVEPAAAQQPAAPKAEPAAAQQPEAPKAEPAAAQQPEAPKAEPAANAQSATAAQPSAPQVAPVLVPEVVAKVDEQVQHVADVPDPAKSSASSSDGDGLIDPTAFDSEDLHQRSVTTVVGNEDGVYAAKFGDTLGSVAAKTGVSLGALRSLNPFIGDGPIAEGSSIRLTADAPYVPYQTPTTLVDSILYRVRPAVPDEAVATSGTERTIAVMLPFDVDNETISRQSLLATDFYKGFLLAVHEDAARCRFPMRILAIDTQCDSLEFDKRLAALSDQNVSVIIPTDDESQLERIERFALDNNILVLNALNVKDEGYLRYPNVIQCNINQRMMYDKAIQALQEDFADYTPVVLDLSGGKDEKASFIDELHRHYARAGREVINLSFRNKLALSDIKSLPANGKYIFIPKSGTTEVFSKIYEGLIEAIEEDPVSDNYKVFGYPDWITYRGEHAESLHRMGANIYSRFFLNEDDPVARDVIDQYVRWYGNQMEEVYPSQGMLGYDTGKLLLSKLRRPLTADGQPDFSSGMYEGQQSSFRFVRDGRGLINDVLFIIEYMPGESTYGKAI